MLSGVGDEAPVEGGAPADPDLVAWARGLGALQEAERLGSSRIGTEHLLLASLLDPVARRLAHDAGIDFRTVQRHLGPPVRAGIGARPGLLPTTAQMYLSDGAGRALAAVRDGAAGEALFADWVRPDLSTDPRARSVLRRRLLALLVAGEGADAARSVLARLEVEPRRDWLVARLADPDDPRPR
ncbi:Clp protease N-terminal domain-containing protein [Actinomycetospora lutea]|uniref:Clp protease N-terminal domain-containing protein n=1 Tax=Actinomycetospora lutea TaxID=663604 RepID=UPI0023668149|nr:Clp protease N-terminal domain-containing protein [Actinomycetospora lutea]MDD7939181.1 Clp protease N-terminal domain-containing protein [Actinomycetospora lutea]